MAKYHIINTHTFDDISYWQNAIVHWAFIATMFVNISVWILLGFFVHPTELPLRLQYNVFFGTSLHTPWWYAYMLPLMGMVFFLIDLMVGYILYRAKERIAAYIVLLGALFANIALLIAAVSVVFNNFIL
jgi:hypothetical protein